MTRKLSTWKVSGVTEERSLKDEVRVGVCPIRLSGTCMARGGVRL